MNMMETAEALGAILDGILLIVEHIADQLPKDQLDALRLQVLDIEMRLASIEAMHSAGPSK